MNTKPKTSGINMPQELDEKTVATIYRISSSRDVMGLMLIRHKRIEVCTMPAMMAQVFARKLPQINEAVMHALTEIDVFDELIAYRIETKTFEVLVSSNKDFCACVIHRTKRRLKKKE